MRTVAVFGIKGGVGKTTVAVNLAYSSAVLSGRRTLLWDLDGQGAASYVLGIDDSRTQARRLFNGTSELASMIQPTDYANLDLLPADITLRHIDKHIVETGTPKMLSRMLKSLEEYDRVILDCPPGLGSLSEQIIRAVHLIVMPMLPAPLSERAYEQLVEHLEKTHRGEPEVLPVFSMVDRRKSLHLETINAAKRRIALPYNSQVEQMSVHRAPIGALAPSSPAAGAFAQLWTRVERMLVKKGR